jgi:PAS domain S-box-containing protein
MIEDKATILVVEDDRTNSDLILEYLKSTNFKVLMVQDGASALEQVKHTKPDIILLDVIMPGMDGFETCRRLKENKETKDIPVIFLSVVFGTKDKVKGFQLGAVDYITKPIHQAELLARINTHLTIRNLRKDLEEQNKRLQEENLRRSRVQDAVRESRERYRFLAENATDIISRQNREGVFIYVSPACRTLLGYEIDEMVGHSIFEFIHPQDLKNIPQLNYPLQEWAAVSTITYQARRKDDTYIWLETTTRISREPETGLIVEITAVSRNVTERKEAEQALQKAHDELEQRVQERTLELAKTGVALGRFVPYEFLYYLGRETIIDIDLGDQAQREMTILFADIRDFTPMSEVMSPQENFNFLNVYLGRVSPIIRQYNGFIDKYIGDTVMALFPKKPQDALQAAIAMQQEVANYNVHRQKQGYKPIKIGIGLHTGTLMLGIIGEAERMESTVISDAVNLASRIEGLTKIYGASILISQNTLFDLEHHTQYDFRFLDRVQVKGKQEPVSVFEIFSGDSEEMIALKVKTLTDFEKGLLHYHSREFTEAAICFEQVVKHNPQDEAAQLYLKRTTYFIQYGVPPDWEGIEALDEK